MPGVGYIQVKAFTSRAQIPVEDAAISILDDDGKLLALRVTDQSGNATPVVIKVPNALNTQSPDTGKSGFTTVNIYARAENYEQILARGVQVFEDVVTLQELSLIPLSELPGKWNDAEIFDTPPQDL